jgi:hypothetical protein
VKAIEGLPSLQGLIGLRRLGRGRNRARGARRQAAGDGAAGQSKPQEHPSAIGGSGTLVGAMPILPGSFVHELCDFL